jgi:hypothetical protein
MDEHPFAAMKVADIDHGADALAREPKMNAVSAVPRRAVAVLLLHGGAACAPDCPERHGKLLAVGFSAGA